MASRLRKQHKRHWSQSWGAQFGEEHNRNDTRPSWSSEYWNEEVAEQVPPAKRARTRVRPSRKPAVTAVRITGVPVEYTYDMLIEMHESFGLDVGVVKDMEFESIHSRGRNKREPAVRAVTVTYTDEETAAAAVECLEGQPVANRVGDTLHLGTELVRSEFNGPNAYRNRSGPDSSVTSVRRRDNCVSVMSSGFRRRRDISPSRASGAFRQGSMARSGGRWGTGSSAGPTVIYPSAYISDVPVEYKEDTMLQLHKACSLDPATVMGMKFLPPQEAMAETCCCIVRYLDQESADKAVAAIRGRPVLLRSGACKFFGAKIAKPARWMVEKGIPEGSSLSEHGVDAPQSAGQGPGPEAAFTWCAKGQECTGTAGMLLYEDISSGLPYCEACWDSWHFEQGMASASLEEDECA